MIYHVTELARWERSLAEGSHTGSTRGVELAEEGFIHCSSQTQLDGVLERFYAGVPDLVVLHVDESRLSAPVVWEQVGDAPEPFPHVYGPIDLDAVVAVTPPESIDRARVPPTRTPPPTHSDAGETLG